MLSILKKELRYQVPWLPIGLIVFWLCWRVQESYSVLEFSYFMLPLIACGLLFNSQSEIELIRISNTQLCNVLAIRYFVTYLYLSLPQALWLLFIAGDNAPKEALTLLTTLLFITSISLLFRVLVKTPFATIMLALLSHTVLAFSFKLFLSETIMLSNPKAIQRFTPYFANTIKNDGVYGNNRLIVLGVTVFILLLSYFIARRSDRFLVE